jgi:hypothetical protein
MLRLALTLPSRSQNLFQYAAFNSSAPINSLRPPLDLDESMQALLKEGDISLKSAKISPKALRELEFLDNLSIEQQQQFQHSLDEWKSMVFSETEITESESTGERKSPAASFGSKRIGMVIIPLELNSAIKQLVAGMHPVKITIIIVHIGSQTETNHKFEVMRNGCFNLTQITQMNQSGTPSMSRTMVPSSRLLAMAQEMERPLLLLPFRRIIPA